MKNLPELIAALDADAPLATRHVWLIQLFQWLRGDGSSKEEAVGRLQLFIDAVSAEPAAQTRLKQWWQTLMHTVDITTLLADFGFAPRAAFFSEFAERLRRMMLPGTPETTDGAELFALAAPLPFDAVWLGAISEAQIGQLASLLSNQPLEDTERWQHALFDSMTYCTAQIRSTGFSPELRLRMDQSHGASRAYHQLPADLEAMKQAFFDADRAASSPEAEAAEERLAAAAAQLRERLTSCQVAINTVYSHLEEHGISVGLVFRVRQLRKRILRVRDLMACVLAPKPSAAAARLLARLAVVSQETKSLRALVAANSTLLAAKMSERSAETGEHYITRDRAEYRQMLGKAMGGGAVTALTTLLKFTVAGFALSAFWGGFGAGLVYAASFVLVQLLGFTLATKQPAMTAPAMAAKLKDMSSGDPSEVPEIETQASIDAFVSEVTHLVRSQAAAVLGNVAMVVPAVLLVNVLHQLLLGTPILSPEKARHVLASLTLLGPTLVWAAFTGVILFTASLIAGWVENWFVLHRLGSAIRHNPRITGFLGAARAERTASFMRENISGLASNISLGFMLGLIPAFTGFFGFEIEVRHVTLSAGQLAASAAALGLDVLKLPEFWWCVAAIPLIGVVNVTVSFYCAFRLALQAHNVSGLDRRRIRRAIWQRLRTDPRSFFAPG